MQRFLSPLYSIYDWLGISSDEASPDHLFLYSGSDVLENQHHCCCFFAQFMHNAVS